MQYVKHIELDVANCNLYKCIYAKQGDAKSRYIKATILANGEKVTISSGMTAKFRAEKPDGKAILNPAVVNDDGTVTVELTEQTLAAEGVVDADIVIYSASGEKLSTVPFKIDVEKAPHGSLADSKNEMLVLQKLIDDSEAAIKKLGNVKDGKDGVSPTVSTAATTGGTKVTITDAKGSHEFVVKDGAKGKDGKPGAAGADGVTPHIGDNGNWHIGSTDTGKPSRGVVGLQGKPGKTPVRGTDYWTAADKQEIVNDIHPAFYIDLAGDYPNYTCPVAMDDIKAAYNSGYNLVCRCTLAAYTATLPLFVPVPAANTWIFSGSGALAAMSFPTQSLTIAIVNGTVQASNTRLASMDDIPTIPTTLKNPNALTIKIGSTAVTYDGSAAKTVEIADGSEVSY